MPQYFDFKQLLSDTGDVTERTGFSTGSDLVKGSRLFKLFDSVPVCSL